MITPRLIPLPAYHWTREAKDLHNLLRDALIEGKEPLPLLKQGCKVFCHDDLLLVTSWLQVKNLVRTLIKLMPLSPEISTWDNLLDHLQTEIENLDVRGVVKEFNVKNLRNEKVIEILRDEGVAIQANNLDAWKCMIIAGQTFWLK
jgi:hypothetical protein